MKPVPRPSRIEGPAAAAGAVLIVGCLVAGCFDPAAAAPAFRLAAVVCLQPALGCLIFLLIHHLSGGQWGETLSPMLRAGARLVPWIWPVLGAISVWHWSRPDLPLPEHARPLPGFLTVGLRAIVYEVILIWVRWIALAPGKERFAGPALILLVFAGHFLAADTFFVLEPGWYSSAFPIVWMAISSAAGFALALACSLIGGCDPSQPGSAGRAIGLDAGNLLLTSVIFATYVAFMEFLIIWSGNLPNEISWFERRYHHGWQFVMLAIVAAHLAFPFVFLLQRRVKQSGRLLPIALCVCAGEVVWAVWLILPPFTDRGPWLAPLCAGCVLGGAALFVNRYLRFCREGAAT